MSSAVQMGRYVVERTLAIGGMSEVFLAHLPGPEGFRRRVVVKRLLPQLADRPDAVDLFLNEARIAACFHHPNLITVYELFQASGQYCLVMELLDGVDLSQIMRRLGDLKRLPDPFQAAAIIADAAFGLHYAHELRGDDGTPISVVHRDISPSNLFVTWPGQVKVVDFGIAKLGASMKHDADGKPVTELRGKLPYMSPEQVGIRPLDRRSDVFSLGTVLYEFLTGYAAFPRDAPVHTMRAILGAKVRPIRSLRKDIPEELVAVCTKMMAKNPADRYATAEEVGLILQDLVRCRGARDIDTRALLEDIFPDRTNIGIRRVPTAMIDVLGSDDVVTVSTEVALPKRTTKRFAPAMLAMLIAASVSAVLVSRSPRRTDAATHPPQLARVPASTSVVSPAAPPSVEVTIVDVPLPEAPALEGMVDEDAPAQSSHEATRLRVSGRSTKAGRSKGRLVVDVDPWADVYVQGKKLGTTPLQPTLLDEGTYTLELRNPVERTSRLVSVRVVAGKLAKVYATLR